jgi:hypothetical protein
MSQPYNPPANAPQLNFLATLLFPGGVIIPLRNSYAAKLIPTYGATPKAVVTNPLYNPFTPPSSLIIFEVIPHIVRSILVYLGGAAVWYADANACVAWLGIEDGTVFGPVAAAWATSDTEAVAIDNRDLTRSKGYVEPEKPNQSAWYTVVTMDMTYRRMLPQPVPH